MRIRVTREACCSQDDQLGPLEATYDLPPDSTLEELIARIEQSRFLQYAYYNEMLGIMENLSVVKVFRPYHDGGKEVAFLVPPDKRLDTFPGEPVLRFCFIRDKHPTNSLIEIGQTKATLSNLRRPLHNRIIFTILFLISVAENGVALSSLPWAEQYLPWKIIVLFFTYLPVIVWSLLFIPLKNKRSLLNLYFGCWFIVLLLGAIFPIKISGEEACKDLAWLGILFFWGILGLCAWTTITSVALYHRLRIYLSNKT